MKNNYSLKKYLILTLLVWLIISIFILNFNLYKYYKYTNNYNNKIVTLVNAIIDKYPNLTENEIITLLNTEKSNENFNLAKYGIDLKNDTLVIANNQLLKKFLVIDIVASTSIVILILLIFLNYNHHKDQEIKSITKLIEQINCKNYQLDIDNNSEGELSFLQNEVYKTTIMLKEQAENAQQDKTALKESLASISHQLKTPLTSMLIMLDNLLDNPKMDTQTREKFIIQIRREITNINFLVQNILKLSMFDANVIHFIPQDIKLDTIINEAIKNLSSLCDLKNIKINYQNNEKITISCDLKWQIEAITNILKNCIEHSFEDSVVDIMTNENKMYKEIIIKDYGQGIKQKDLNHLFDRYYKGSNSLPESNGIGISLAKEIIDHSNGIILVSSVVNEGTTFKIRYY